MRPHRLSPTSALVALAGLAILTSGQAPPAEPPAPAAVAPPIAGGQPGFYLGMGTCLASGCHGSPRARAGDTVLGNEYFTWLRQDPHQRAYNVLFDGRSQRIAANLRLGAAHTAQRCLDCHALAVPAEKLRGSLALEDGISCEGCHGPASGWRDGHTDPSWTHADSLAKGLVDLPSPAVRARTCLGCHLGQGARTVDHELIAAGHPALTFELETWGLATTPHWKPRPGTGAATWAVGQAASFRRGLEELARRARSERWPDFVDFSCYSCHHSLKDERWRKADAFRGRERIGLPPWSPARWAVLRELVELAAPGERNALDAKVRELAAAVERLKGPAEVAAKAEEAAAMLGRVEGTVAALAWDAPRVRTALAALAADRDGWLGADVHSAEQAYFATRTLVGFLVGGDPLRAGGELSARLDRLYDDLDKDPEAFDRERFRGLLAGVAEAVGR